MSYASVTNVDSTWTPKYYAELTKDGTQLLNPLVATSTSVTASGTLNPRTAYTRVDTTAGAVTISLGATAALMREYVGKQYTIFTNDGGNILTVTCPTGAIMFGNGAAAAASLSSTAVPLTPACITLFVYSTTHVQVVSSTNMA